MCLLNRHKKSKVEWDGMTYRSSCERCGVAIVRLRHKLWHKAPRRASRDHTTGSDHPAARPAADEVA